MLVLIFISLFFKVGSFPNLFINFIGYCKSFPGQSQRKRKTKKKKKKRKKKNLSPYIHAPAVKLFVYSFCSSIQRGNSISLRCVYLLLLFFIFGVGIFLPMLGNSYFYRKFGLQLVLLVRWLRNCCRPNFCCKKKQKYNLKETRTMVL